MTTVKEYRRRGFQYRRLSFILKVLTGLWSISMIALWLTGGTWMHFFAAVTGSIAFCVPAILIAATFDGLAERQFNLASSHAPLLGVVRPR